MCGECIKRRYETRRFLFGNIAGHNNCLYCYKFTSMQITIDCGNQNPSTPNEITQALKNIINNQSIIMAAIDDLKTQVSNLQTQVTDLQTALDAEQAAIQQLLETNAGVVTDLNQQIQVLQEQVANGASAEQINEVVTQLSAISNNIATTKADLESTVPDQSNNSGGEQPQTPSL